MKDKVKDETKVRAEVRTINLEQLHLNREHCFSINNDVKIFIF